MKSKISEKKGRCWKGCKPVPGSCGMDALTPGMVLFGKTAALAPLAKLEFAGGYAMREGEDSIIYKEPGAKGFLKRNAGKLVGGVVGAPLFVAGQASGNPLALLGGMGSFVAGGIRDAHNYKKSLIPTMAERPRKLKKDQRASAKSVISKHSDGSLTVVPLESLRPGMIEFMLGGDNRPRNGNGQFVANETGGADPNSMAAAYGNVEQEKMARRQGLIQRMKQMLKGGNAEGENMKNTMMSAVLEMGQKATFSDGGYVLHKVKGPFSGHASAWYDKTGELLDAEQILVKGVRRTARPIRKGGAMWAALQRAGKVALSELRPGMIEFAQGQVVAGLLGIKNAVRLPKSAPGSTKFAAKLPAMPKKFGR